MVPTVEAESPRRGSQEATPADPTDSGLHRSALAYLMLCAWNNIDPALAPPAWWHHPSDSNRAAWERVAQAAADYIERARG